jgi:hypothetical protein
MHDHDNNIKCPFCKNEVNIKKALMNEYSPEVHSAYKERFKEKDEEQAKITAVNHNKEVELSKWEERLKSQDNTKEIDKRIDKAAEEKANLKIQEMIKEEKEKAKAIYSPQLDKASNIESENIELRQKLLAFEQNEKVHDKKTQQAINEALAKQQEKHNQDNEFKDIKHAEDMNKAKKNFQHGLTQANQGSNQAQGDVGEISVNSHLKALYPLDDITRTAKGANGADILQKVSFDGINDCGKIYLEIKRTQNYDKNWLSKLNSDSREKKANVPILISKTLPPEMTHPKCVDGIWICSFQDYEHLVQIHRDYLISNHKSSQAQINSVSGSMLTYNYVNSDDFNRVVENMYANLSKTQEQVDIEKKCMNKSWSERLAIGEVLGKNMATITGTLKAYSTNSQSEVNSLEMDEVA